MSLSTQGTTPGPERTSGLVVEFIFSDFAAATCIGRSREAATATTRAKPSATIIAPVPTLRSGSLSYPLVRLRRRTSGSRYRPHRRTATDARRFAG